jgi:ferredoxin-NADP reductase
VDLVRRWCAGAPDGTEYFLCGPKPMSDLAEDGLRRSGVPISRIHRELFDMA